MFILDWHLSISQPSNSLICIQETVLTAPLEELEALIETVERLYDGRYMDHAKYFHISIVMQVCFPLELFQNTRKLFHSFL